MLYHVLLLIIKLFSYIPFCVLYFLSDILFFLVYYIVRYRRKLVRQNLTESFPHKSSCEIEILEKKFYKHFVDFTLEIVKMATISPTEMSKRMKFTNVDVVNEQIKEGKSISLFLGHYANWEWVSSLPLWLEKNISGGQIYHQLKNQSIDKLMLFLRGRMGAVNVEMRKTARYINNLSIEGKISVTGYIADQSPKKQFANYFLKFLNHETPVLVGTEKITKRYGFDAWFLKIKKIKRGYYEAEFIQMHNDSKSLPDYELTAIYYTLLEKMISERPEFYLWSHNRFKHAKK